MDIARTFREKCAAKKTKLINQSNKNYYVDLYNIYVGDIHV